MLKTMMVAGVCLVGMGGTVGVKSAGAQQMVHAMTGTVSAADAAQRTFTLKADNGNTMFFQAQGKQEKEVRFDKDLQSQATDAAAASAVGTHVLVFYYGYDTVLTAVGMEKLGDAPVTRVVGPVKDFDKHKHTITLADVPAAAQMVELSAKTVVDTPGGVVAGPRFHPNKGERVGVYTSGSGGGNTVWLVMATGPGATM